MSFSFKSSFGGVFKDKNILITGHTGFKGAWLTSWLRLLDANIMGISIDLPTSPSHFDALDLKKKILDLRLDVRSKKIELKIKKFKPDFIFHLAAQSTVMKSYNEPILTWDTNVLGTANLLSSLENYKKNCVVILITSDKCYDNAEWEWGYRETDKLGGSDPYSSSKAATEILIQSFVKSFLSKNKKIKIASVRAGNVIGGGDWSEDRLIPDIIKSWKKNTSILIRNPNATRPWQHVLEPLSGYLDLASNIYRSNKFHGHSFNFGPRNDQINNVKNVLDAIKKYLPKKNLKIKIKKNNREEHKFLKLNCDKALSMLGWFPVLTFDETIKKTMEWYLSYYSNLKQTSNYTNQQIIEYFNLAKIRKHKWAINFKKK